MSGFVGNGPQFGRGQRFTFIASAGATSFTGADSNGLTLNYVPGYECVYLNGTLITRADYVATNGSSITGLPALNAGDVIDVVANGVLIGDGAAAKDQNLADLPDKTAARNNLGLWSNSVFHDAFNVTTNGSRVGITNDANIIAAPPALLSVHYTGSGPGGNTLNARGYWTGTTASPYQNNDTILSEAFNKIESDSLNRSWAGSFCNGFNSIPAGVTDSGTRVGVIGWAVSFVSAGYKHEGTLNSQIGVQGTAGFQSAGSGTSAIIQDAVGVRGEVYNDSVGSTIQNARAGAFVSQAATGVVQNNYAVYALAINGTVSNYSFYGAAGTFYNDGDAEFNADLKWVGGPTTDYAVPVTAVSGTIGDAEFTGVYKRLGKYVFIEGIVSITDIGTASGRVKFALPINQAANLVGFPALQAIYEPGFATTAAAVNWDAANYVSVSISGLSSGAHIHLNGVYRGA
jgi:hypothetical protein